MQRNILVVFLASPSDLQDERMLVKQTVERINRIFGKTVGWQIELRGWEDALPDYRRPQEIINRDVDECELFIGMLWTRWGTPTAEFSSGFHEEFERVRSRWLDTKHPSIWLLFRKVDPERLKDLGPQLKQVLDFKEQQVARNELLFKEFETPENCAALIHDQLTEFLLNLSAKQRSQRTEQESDKSPQLPTTAGVELVQEEHSPIVEQNEDELIALMDRTTRILREDPNNFNLTLDERARLLVATTAWFSPKHSYELLGIHELHIAFRNRQDWRHTSSERMLLFRTMVADSHDLRPGWYWIRVEDANGTPDFLRFFALNDHKDEVRQGAVAMCSRLGIGFDRSDLQRLLTDDEEQVVLETIRLIRTAGQQALAGLLEPLLSDSKSSVREAAGIAFYDLMFALDPAGVIRHYLANGAKPTSWLNKEKATHDIPLDAAVLKQALTHSEIHVRTYAAERLRLMGDLDRAGWQQLLGDPEERIKEISVQALIDQGETFDWQQLEQVFPSPSYGARLSLLGFGARRVDKEALLARQIRRESDDNLIAKLKFYGMEGPIVYDVLCERNYAVLEGRIRSDLNSEFLALKRESDARLRSILNEAADSILSRWKPEAIEHIQNEFVAVALRHLADHASPEDAAMARKFMTRSRVSTVVASAVRVLATVGQAEDVELLLDARKNLWGKNLKLAVETALGLAADKVGLLRRLLQEEDVSRFISAIINVLNSLEIEDRVAVANDMIRSSDDSVRKRGVATLVRTLSNGDLEKLLQQYSSQGTYYYDVVTWLDRVLYAAETFRDRYRQELLLSLV